MRKSELSHTSNGATREGIVSQLLEYRIATVLWQWKFAKRDQRDALLVESDFPSLLEFWFPFSSIEFTRERGIWCDGVPLFEIQPLDRLSISIVGVGIFQSITHPLNWSSTSTGVVTRYPAASYFDSDCWTRAATSA